MCDTTPDVTRTQRNSEVVGVAPISCLKTGAGERDGRDAAAIRRSGVSSV